jgi:hypothetical protein
VIRFKIKCTVTAFGRANTWWWPSRAETCSAKGDWKVDGCIIDEVFLKIVIRRIILNCVLENRFSGYGINQFKRILVCCHKEYVPLNIFSAWEIESQSVPTKRLYTSMKIHGSTAQKATILLNAVRLRIRKILDYVFLILKKNINRFMRSQCSLSLSV